MVIFWVVLGWINTQGELHSTASTLAYIFLVSIGAYTSMAATSSTWTLWKSLTRNGSSG